MVKVDVMTHIKAQVWTSLPAFVIACVVFLILGLAGPPPISTVGEAVELAKLDQIYWINPVNLLPLALLIFMSVRKCRPRCR
jgi:Na+:H+ antiporter, NhaC family